MFDSSDKIVITGCGVVSSLGHACGRRDVPGKKSYYQRLLNGESGLTAPQFGEGTPLINAVGVVEGCELADLKAVVLKRKALTSTGRTGFLAVLAAHYALQDSGMLNEPETNPFDVGVMWAGDTTAMPLKSWIDVGKKSLTGNCSFWKIVQTCTEELDPKWQMHVMTSGATANVALQWGFKGPSTTHTSACAAGIQALQDGYRNLKEGVVKYAVVGGSDSKLSPWNIGGFMGLCALSTRKCAPEEASAPCSRERDGFVLGEGGVCFVLERYSDAKARGANIYAEVAGFGASCGGESMVDTSPEAVERCIRRALLTAEVNPGDLSMISAHATSTPAGDHQEVNGIHAALGVYAKRPWVYNSKGAVGHLIVPAGLMSLLPAVLAVKYGVIPPNLNLSNPDPRCDLHYSLGASIETKVEAALVTALGFGGANMATVIRAV